ncbi:DUF6298 domain-containing protein [Marinoscillum sp. MHG1-6]|uniref:DUF6298 domain-containing protein n=1 Tax=Marinoscillum sp. MHG1-6 TaxID=2959627 RepID=UPI0021575B32|nr:DUF6298 domain-containing protein [Marinoscillum sp. MHG1-6]
MSIWSGRPAKRKYSLDQIGMIFILVFSFLNVNAQEKIAPVSPSKDGLSYLKDELGNQVPDYSYAGYKASDEEIPTVEIEVFIDHKEGDQTSRIQKAIDYVSNLPMDANGYRGAVLLGPGDYRIDGGLEIRASGVVIRGSGNETGKTTLLGTGLDRTTLIRVFGANDVRLGAPINVNDDYVPVGAMSLSIEDVKGIKVGDEIRILRPSTKEWIEKLQMQHFGGETGYIGWKAGERDIYWNRKVVSITGNEITLDAPLTTALDKEYGGGLVSKMEWPGRIENVGIENLKLESTFDTSNPKDEQHRWMAIVIENTRDAWVRQVNFEHFAGSAVAIWETGSRVTVEDCKSLNPVSEIGGQRRYTFITEGQQCLFQRLYAEYGYHDFAVGFRATGPNAFVECRSVLPHSFSGTIDSWASGVLFDIVNIDAQALRFSNRGMEVQGAGYTAANSMFWQCSASLIECPAPPTAMNWACGAWSQFAGNGYWYEANSFVKPRSLFYGQLADRLGKEAYERGQLLPLEMEATSSPTVEQAEEYIAQAYEPQIQLIDWISEAAERNPISISKGDALDVDNIKCKTPKTEEKALVLSKNDFGRLVLNDQLAYGATQPIQWWRGNVRYYDAMKTRPHVSRYVPGKTGTGYTDDLDEATTLLTSQGVTVLEHNYGLWYDRRRDDHERVRRMNGEVWAPFYELPFARSGQGISYDGMSKYDLTQYNYWYWNRLSKFVEYGEEKGLIFYHQNYFQHNILEAGGHYADFPWRTANNVNETPFPEPVNYAGDKRIFIAEQFYDVSNPEYRSLHEAYIRKCLDNFSEQSNVIQFTSAEYTGPLSFIEFWLDVIARWQDETGKEVMVALSATKDVQDAILQDPVRSKIVDVIDVQYWWYGENKAGESELYAPEGGKNLAPRQHARLVKTPKETFESTYKSVFEYKSNYPDKAVIHNTHRSQAFGWAIFIGGGSLMNIPKVSDTEFSRDVALMSPYKIAGTKALKGVNGEQILYIEGQSSVDIDLTGHKGKFEVCWVNESTGEVLRSGKILEGQKKHQLTDVKSSIVWLDKK